MKQKIVILNGEPGNNKDSISDYLQNLEVELQTDGKEVKSYHLNKLEVKHCTGCFDCWLKTPGICRFNDDVEEVLRNIIHADLLIFASPLIMGMYSAFLKRFQDRMIPILHPYLEMVNDECHHKKRYPKYPDIGFIFDENDATREEIENVHFIHQRMALNMRGDLLLFTSVQQKNYKELSYEISHI